MYAGTGVLCFSVSDVQRSIRFYEAIGLTGWRHPSGLAGGVGRGSFHIYLMGFDCKGDWVNFRGADAFAVQAHLQASAIEAKGKPEHTTQPGTSWLTEDPDGHLVFFNTSEEERTAAGKHPYVVNHFRGLEQDLIDCGASEECLHALRQHVLATLGIEEARTVPAWPYTGPPLLCFRVSNLERSVRFYETIGLTVTHREPQAALIRRSQLSIYLSAFDDGVDCIHFRGANAFEVHARLRRSGIEAPGEPSTGDSGASWMTEDPDGHKTFFNTSQRALTTGGRQTRVAELLRGTEQHLVDWDASEECLQAFREHVLARFGST